MDQKKIKIVYIVPSLASGGAERFIIDLINSLDKNVFTASLLLFSGKGFFYQEALDSGIKIKVIKKRFKFDVINFLKICSYIKLKKPDIVHTQLGGDVYGKLAAKIMGVKIIVSTEQNVLENDKKIVFNLKKMTTKFTQQIIAISSVVKKQLIERYGYAEEKTKLIPNGINIHRFADYIKKNNNSDKIIIGSIGRLSQQKNYQLLIRALSLVENRNFKLLIAGEGPLEGELKKLALELKLENQIEFWGETKDIGLFLSSLDFFVLTSKWEGLGIVLLEAGLMSLPVLASNTGGIPDIIKNNKTGMLFNNDDPDDLLVKLNYFLDSKNREELSNLGSSLKSFVVDNFSLTRTAEEYQKVYLELINKK